jgi:hypothetical protein
VSLSLLFSLVVLLPNAIELPFSLSDTRILLCPTSTGIAQALTESHHAETVVESARLRRMSAVTGGSVVDAFGESRWLGSVENTRAFGDGRWKGLGVSRAILSMLSDLHRFEGLTFWLCYRLPLSLRLGAE